MNLNELKSVISKRECSLIDLFSKLDSAKLTETLQNLDLVWNDLPSKLGATLIVEEIIEGIFKSNNVEIRTALVDLGLRLISEFPLSLLSKEEITKFKASVKNIYINKLGEFRNNHDPLWHKIWVLLIRFLQKHLHNETALANCMLRLIENAFRTPEDRIDSYNCWKELIDNYSLNESYIAQPKHVKLLVIPLTATISKADAVTVKRFEVWVHLIKAMKQSAVACFSQFLNFCFGPLSENPLIESDGAPIGPGKRCAVIYSDVAEFFMESLGHQGHCSDSCVIGNVKKYVLDKVVINSCNLEKVDEDVFRAVCECCLLLQKWGYSSTKDKVTLCLWKSFISILENADDAVVQRNVARICWFLINLADASNKKDAGFYLNLLTNINKTLACSKVILIPLLRELPKKTVSITGCKKAVAQLTEMAAEHFGKLEFLKMSSQIFKNPHNPNDNCNVLGDIWMEMADLGKSLKFTGEVNKFFEKDGLGFLLWAAQNLHCVSTENKQKILQAWTALCKEICKNSKESTHVIVKALSEVSKQNPLTTANVVLMQNSLEDFQPVVKLEICNLEIKTPYANLLQKSTISPAKIKGSQLNNASPKVQKKPANVVPSLFKSPTTKTTKDDDSKFVIIDTEYKFDRSKLSEHQKEVLKKRRDDIPSLYQDLSQDTQSQSNSLNDDSKSCSAKEILKDGNQIEPKSEAENKTAAVADENCVGDKSDSEKTVKENNNLQEDFNATRRGRGRPKTVKTLFPAKTDMPTKGRGRQKTEDRQTDNKSKKLKVERELEKLRMDVRGADQFFVEKRTRKSLQNNSEFLYSPLRGTRNKTNKDLVTEEKSKTGESVAKESTTNEQNVKETPKDLQKKNDEENPSPKRINKNEDAPKESPEKIACASPKRDKTDKKTPKKSPEAQTEEIIESSQKNLVEVLPVQNSLIADETPGSPKKSEDKTTPPRSPKPHKDSEEYYVTPESPDRRNGLKITISRIKSPPENNERSHETPDNQNFTPESPKKSKNKKKSSEENTIPEIFDKMHRRSARSIKGSMSPKKTGTSDSEENILTPECFSIVEQFKIAPEKFCAVTNPEPSEIVTLLDTFEKIASPKKTAPEKFDALKDIESPKTASSKKPKSSEKNASPKKSAAEKCDSGKDIESPKTVASKKPKPPEKNASPKKSAPEECDSGKNIESPKTSSSKKLKTSEKNASPKNTAPEKCDSRKDFESSKKLKSSSPRKSRESSRCAPEKSAESPKKSRVILKLSPRKSGTSRHIQFPENNTPTDSEKRDSILETETCNPYESLDVELTMALDEPTKSPLNNSGMQLCEKETESANFSETPEKEENLPGSPVTTETPTRNTELLLNTTDISPIRSPQCPGNDVLQKFVSEQLEEILKASTEQKPEDAPEDKSLTPENQKGTPRSRGRPSSLRSAKLFSLIPGKSPLNIKPAASSPKTSRKSAASPKTHRVKKMLANLEKKNADVENDFEGNSEKVEYEIISVSPKTSTASPKTLRVRKMMAKLDKKYAVVDNCTESDKNLSNGDKVLNNAEKDSPENCKDTPGDLGQINPEDVLIFEREVPSPFATPAGGSILKRKKPDCPDEITPSAKRKRVNFSDPLTTSRKLFVAEDSNIVMLRPHSTETKNLKTDTNNFKYHTQPSDNKVLENVIETLQDEIHKMECEIVQGDVVAIDDIQQPENTSSNVEQLKKQQEKSGVNQTENVHQKTEDVIVIEEDSSSDKTNETVIDIEINSCNSELKEESSERVEDDKVLGNTAESSDSRIVEKESETERRDRTLGLFKDAIALAASLDANTDENLEVLGFAFRQLASIMPKMYCAKQMHDITVAEFINK